MRLIDADALWEIFREKQNSLTARRGGYRFLDDEDRAEYDRLEITLAYIENAPEVDVVPVVRGEWLVTDAYPHRVYCSLCYKTNVPNEEWLYEKNDYPKYCMWCGAKMEDKT